MSIEIAANGFRYGSDLPERDKIMDPMTAGIMAADRVVSALPHGTTTFSTEDIYPVLAQIMGDSEENIRKTTEPVIVMHLACNQQHGDYEELNRTSSEVIMTVRNDAINVRIAPEGSEFQYIVSPRGVSIPPQLKDAKFILLLPESKIPYGSSPREKPICYVDNMRQKIKISWENSRYQYDYTEMSAMLYHKYADYNYAVVDESYVVIDCDDYDGMVDNCPEIDNLVASTFTVKSGRDTSVGYHLYLHCNDIPAEWMGKKLSCVDPDTKDDLGDIRLYGKFLTLGAGSTHPDSGNKYVVHTDLPIKTVEWNELQSIFEPVIKKKHVPKKFVLQAEAEMAQIPHDYEKDESVQRLGITVTDVLFPDNAVDTGEDYIGSHPIHGSSTGHNFAVQKGGSCWYCFRHNCGGGLLSAIAIKLGIRQCGDDFKPFTKEEWEKVNAFIKEHDPEHFQDFINARKMKYLTSKRANTRKQMAALIAAMNSEENHGN